MFLSLGEFSPSVWLGENNNRLLRRDKRSGQAQGRRALGCLKVSLGGQRYLRPGLGKKGLGQLLLLALMEFTGEGGCSTVGRIHHHRVLSATFYHGLSSALESSHCTGTLLTPSLTKQRTVTICWVPQGKPRILERGRCALSSLMKPRISSDSTCSVSANGTPGQQIVLKRPFLLLTP